MKQQKGKSQLDDESLETIVKPEKADTPRHSTAAKSAYDEVLVLLGEFGPYHIRAFLLLTLLNIYSAFPFCVIILLFLDVPFRCSVPGLLNDTFHIHDESHQRLVNASIPYDVTTGLYSQCSAYLSEDETNVTVPCQRWVYDYDYPASSYVPHLDLVCDRRYIKTQFITALSVGLVIAVFGSGPGADVFGRKTLMIIFPMVNSVSLLIMTSITYIPAMLVLCFIMCCAIMAAFLISITLIMEMSGPSKRELACLGIQIGWSLGLLLATPYIHLIYDWQISSYSIAAMGFAFALYFWFSLILAYSGMTYNIGEMIEGDVYSNFALQAAMETLGYLVSYILTGYFGRRSLNFCFTLAASISYFVNALSGLLGLGTSWIPILTYATGKFSVTGALFIIYTVANELMPTVVRTTSTGVCCCIGQVGSIAATQMTMLPDLIPTTFGKTLPLFLFSAFLLVSALLTLVLPETKNKELPDTIQEAKDLGRKRHHLEFNGLQVYDARDERIL